MTAALKMAAPGELCAHTKKLMIFCKADAKSIKAMRQHIAVTEARMQELLADMLRHNLVWRQSNGMYKTCNNKLHLVEPATANTDSMAALADATDVSNGEYTAEEASKLEAALEELQLISGHEAGHIADAIRESLGYSANHTIAEKTSIDDTDITELDLELIDSKPFSFPTSEFAPKPYDLTAMANEFEAEQERGDQHVIDNLDAKQRVLNYCQMLLSPTSTEMRRCLDELQMDLAVIRLQQERSV